MVSDVFLYISDRDCVIPGSAIGTTSRMWTGEHIRSEVVPLPECSFNCISNISFAHPLFVFCDSRAKEFDQPMCVCVCVCAPTHPFQKSSLYRFVNLRIMLVSYGSSNHGPMKPRELSSCLLRDVFCPFSRFTVIRYLSVIYCLQNCANPKDQPPEER